MWETNSTGDEVILFGSVSLFLNKKNQVNYKAKKESADLNGAYLQSTVKRLSNEKSKSH